MRVRLACTSRYRMPGSKMFCLQTRIFSVFSGGTLLVKDPGDALPYICDGGGGGGGGLKIYG